MSTNTNDEKIRIVDLESGDETVNITDSSHVMMIDSQSTGSKKLTMTVLLNKILAYIKANPATALPNSIGKVTVNGNFFIPRLPCYYAQGNINIVDGSIDIAAAAAANGFGTPLIIYNSTSSTITVQRSSSATASIGAYKHKIFVRTAGDAIAFYDMMT